MNKYKNPALDEFGLSAMFDDLGTFGEPEQETVPGIAPPMSTVGWSPFNDVGYDKDLRVEDYLPVTSGRNAPPAQVSSNPSFNIFTPKTQREAFVSRPPDPNKMGYRLPNGGTVVVGGASPVVPEDGSVVVGAPGPVIPGMEGAPPALPSEQADQFAYGRDHGTSVSINAIMNSLRKGGMNDEQIQEKSGLTNESARNMSDRDVLRALSRTKYRQDTDKATASQKANSDKRLARRARYKEDGTPRNNAAIAEYIAVKLSEIGTDTVTNKTLEDQLTKTEAKKLKRYYEAESWNGATQEQRREAQRITKRVVDRDKQAGIASQADLKQKNAISLYMSRDERTKQGWEKIKIREDALVLRATAEANRHETNMKKAVTAEDRAKETKRHNLEIEDTARGNLQVRVDRLAEYADSLMRAATERTERTRLAAIVAEIKSVSGNSRIKSKEAGKKVDVLTRELGTIGKTIFGGFVVPQEVSGTIDQRGAAAQAIPPVPVAVTSPVPAMNDPEMMSANDQAKLLGRPTFFLNGKNWNVR